MPHEVLFVLANAKFIFVFPFFFHTQLSHEVLFLPTNALFSWSFYLLCKCSFFFPPPHLQHRHSVLLTPPRHSPGLRPVEDPTGLNPPFCAVPSADA